MEDFIGRSAEIKILTDALMSPQAELIAVYGRRRVGKTYLIRSVYAKHIAFDSALENSGQSTTQPCCSRDVCIPDHWLDFVATTCLGMDGTCRDCHPVSRGVAGGHRCAQLEPQT